MRRAVLCAAVAAIVVPAAASAPTRPRVVRWQITLSVTDGHQALTRLASLSPAGTTGSGTTTSSWTARFRMRVKLDGQLVNFLGASAYSVTGNVTGEYHGSYPKSGGGTVSYSCPIGPLAPSQVQTEFRLRGYGRTTTPLFLTWFVYHEPVVAPPVSCTGGPVDGGVSRTFSYGLFTGFTSSCIPGHPGPPARKLAGTRPFSYSKHFTWSATSEKGHSKDCNGLGGPIGGDASGTVRMSFRRL
jgi:hypothetical protein